MLKPFEKDNSNYDVEIEIYVCPLGEILYRRKTYEYKNKQKITYWTNKCKNCIMKEIRCNKKNYGIIQDYENPFKIKMQWKMETGGTKNLQKTIKNSRTIICTHKTKHETPRIHHKKYKHRIQTIYNRIQPKKNIQRNK